MQGKVVERQDRSALDEQLNDQRQSAHPLITQLDYNHHPDLS